MWPGIGDKNGDNNNDTNSKIYRSWRFDEMGRLSGGEWMEKKILSSILDLSLD
jgi:hypothetical protein